MNRIAFISISIILPLVFAGCFSDPRPERMTADAVAVNIGADPSSLDPSLVTDIPAAKALLALQRGLTFLDQNLEPQPELAERWTISKDGRTYTFHLREAQWSNGDPVTAHDFVYAWTQRVLRAEFASQYAYQLFYIDGAEPYYNDPSLGADTVGARAVDDRRLEVRLKAPAPFFLELVAHHTYFPVHAAVDKANPDWHLEPSTYVGCGPFQLSVYRPGEIIEMTKNPTYWNAEAVGIETLILRMIERESTELIAYENGEIDATNTVPKQDLASLVGRADLYQSRQLATYYAWVNCENEVLGDPRVRRALALATPRGAIVENVTRAGEPVALALTPPELYKGPAPESPLADAAYDEARALLAEAGFPGGEGFPALRYLYNTMEGHRQIALVLQETWRRELGIELTLENQEFKVTIERRRAGDFDLSRAGWVADFADPINFLELLDPDSDNNDSRWYDDHYDDLLSRARAETDLNRRMSLLREAEEYMLSQAPVIPIYYYTQNYLVAPRLEGYRLNPSGLFDPAALRWADE